MGLRQGPGGVADTQMVRPCLLALVLALLLAACGGAPKPAMHHHLGDAVQKVTAEVQDLKGTVVVRG